MRQAVVVIGAAALVVAGLTLAGCQEGKCPFGCPTAKWPARGEAVAKESCGGVILERDTPSQVAVGKTYDEKLKVTNRTGSRIRDVVVTLQLPPQDYRLQSSTPEGRLSNGAMQWHFETMQPGETQTIAIKGMISRPGEVTACADVSYKCDLLCRVVGATEPMLQLTATAPESALLCDTIPVKLVVSNPGTTAAHNVKITHSLSEGVTAVNGKRANGMTIASLGPGQSKEFIVNTRASRTGMFTGEAKAIADGGLTAQASTSTTILQPVLAVTAEAPSQRYVGRPITYNVRVANTGNAPARDLVLTNQLPEGARFVEASMGEKAEDGQVNWKLGTLAPGEFKTVAVTVEPGAKGTAQTVVKASGYCADGTATAKTEVIGVPAIQLEVIDTSDPIQVGANETYEITVLNQGSATDTNVRIVATLPDQLQYVTSTGPTQATVDKQTITFAPLPQLAPQARAVWKVTAKGAAIGDVRFKATLASDQLTSKAEETEPTYIYSGE